MRDQVAMTICTWRADPASEEPPNLPPQAAWVLPPTRGSDEVVLVGVRGGRGARGDPQLREDVAHVPVYRPLAEHELAGDGPVRRAPGDETKHLQLALGESMSGGRLPARRERVHPRDVRGRSQPVE